MKIGIANDALYIVSLKNIISGLSSVSVEFQKVVSYPKLLTAGWNDRTAIPTEKIAIMAITIMATAMSDHLSNSSSLFR